MDDMAVFQLLGQIVGMVMSALIGWLAGKFKNAKTAKEQTEKNAERATEIDKLLLYYRLKDLYNDYVVTGETITTGDKHEVQEVYDYYSELGGNGEGKRMYSEIMKLETV